MGIDLLQSMQSKHAKFVHLPLYDLQAFFFVFVWICVTYAAPSFPLPKLPEAVEQWVTGKPNSIAALKTGQVLTSSSFGRHLGPHFGAHFEDLVDFADNFREELHFDRNDLQEKAGLWETNVDAHERVLELFHKELSSRRAAEIKAIQDNLNARQNVPPDQQHEGPRRSPRDTSQTKKKIQVQIKGK